MFEYEIKQSHKRKTIAIKIKQGHVTVYAPYYVPLSVVKQFVLHKQQWILRKLTIQDNKQKFISPFIKHKFNLFGTEFGLVCLADPKSGFKFENNNLNIYLSSKVKNKEACQLKLLKSYLKQELETYITDRVKYFSHSMALVYSNIKIKTYKSRWGSCNAKGELTFNLLLAGAPKWVIDYVIVHELSHLKYLNHSKLFWSVVTQYYPDYKDAEIWLKAHAMELALN